MTGQERGFPASSRLRRRISRRAN